MAYTTATATQDPSRICDLHHISRWHRILNPLSKAQDRTHNLVVPSRIRFCCTMTGTPDFRILERTTFIIIFIIVDLQHANFCCTVKWLNLCECVCVCTFFFYIIFHHGLALCYIVGLYCLSILNVILCIRSIMGVGVPPTPWLLKNSF